HLPSLHLCAGLRIPIFASVFQNRVAANLVIALAANQLRRMRNVAGAVEPATTKSCPLVFMNEAACQSQFWICLETLNQSFKVCRLDRDVGVQVADEFVLYAAQ